MRWPPLPEPFRTPHNEAVVRFVEGLPDLSAHDEVASALIASARGLPGVMSYCPDAQRYAYVVLHTREHRIFGLAFGMRVLSYRLPDARREEAQSEGGSACADVGGEWIQFDPWQSSVNAQKWCRVAYRHALAPP
jgi:hypothetical protein